MQPKVDESLKIVDESHLLWILKNESEVSLRKSLY